MDPTVYEKLKSEAATSRQYKSTRHGLFMKKENGYVRVIKRPDHEEIMIQLHENGHLGIKAVMSQLRRRYWWPKAQKDVEHFIKTCEACQRDKKPKEATDIYPIKATRPFEIIGIDHVGPLKENKDGYQYLIVAQDYFTKWPIVAPTKSTNTDEALTFVWSNIVSQFGTPEKIITDQGSAFISDHWKRTMKKWHIKHITTTAMNPQANGQVERFNQTLIKMICRSLMAEKTKWVEQIPTVLLAYRTSVQATTNVTPSELLYGFQMKLPIDNKFVTQPEEILEDEYGKQLDELKSLEQRRLLAADRIEKQKEKMKQKSLTKEQPKEYEVGDKVLLYSPKKQHKLMQNTTGPYRIKAVLGKRRYLLETLGGHNNGVVTGRRLIPWLDRNKVTVEVESH